jgi:murein DD-endopeptidase MepM/ murein hydrolase activator NlpD
MRMRKLAGVLLAGLVLAAVQGSGNAYARSPELSLVDGVLPAGTKGSCYREAFCIHWKKVKSGVDAWLEALTSQPITILFKTKSKNLEGPVRAKPIVMTKPGVTHIFRLRKAGSGSWEYSFKYYYHPGRPDEAKPDLDFVYELPFAKGKTHKVSQGNNASNTHKKREAFAVDWNLKSGTAVLAARGGKVIGVSGSTSSQRRGHGNFIWIKHNDGTVGWYQHLRQGGTRVAIGQLVKAGDLIGFSGDTGKSSGPHLHFHVSMTVSGPNTFQTVPIKFRTSKGVTGKIRSGDRHRRPD